MVALLSTIHVIVCLFLILVVLLQQGKGADLSVFGGGGTQTVFGARGAATLLHKLTVGGFIAFILTTIGIGLLETAGGGGSVMTDVVQEAPATEAPPPLDPAPGAETAGDAPVQSTEPVEGPAADADSPTTGDDDAGGAADESRE